MPAELESIYEVLAADCDGLQHLNHVRTVRFLERARGEWYRACGLCRETYGTVVVNINYNYRAECFLGERLRVMTKADVAGTRSFTLSHRIIKPDDVVAVEGQATSVIMDLASRNIIPVPECLAKQFPQRHASENI